MRIKDIKRVEIDEVDFLVTADSRGFVQVWDVLEFLKEI